MKERYTDDEFNRVLDYLSQTIRHRDRALRIMRGLTETLSALGVEVGAFLAAGEELAADIARAKDQQRKRAEAAEQKTGTRPPPTRFT